MKRTLISTVIFLFILTAASTVNSQPDESYDAEIQTSERNQVEIDVSVSDTESERRRGLMNTLVLPENRGMLFVFEDEEMRSFWMKNTYIPLDIIFLNENLRIINIEQASPEPFTEEQQLKRYNSDRPAKYVIEMEKGFSERNNISEGDLLVPGSKLDSCCILKG